MMRHIMTMRFVVAAAAFAVAYPLLAGELPNAMCPSSRLVPELDGNYHDCSRESENASCKRCDAPVALRQSRQDTVCARGANRALMAGRSTSPLRRGRMAAVVASVAIASVVLLNLVATVMLVRSDFLTPLQRVLQLAFVWAVPFIGSIVVIAVLRGARSYHKPRFASDASGNAWLPGSGPQSEAFSGHHGGHGEGGGDAGDGDDGWGGGH
jgi:hypothetical protein